MLRPVIVIAGKDPTADHGGLESYLRAYGRAALRIGFEPHFFCVNDHADVERTAFGIVHRARSPFRPFRTIMLPLHQPFILDCVERFARQGAGPYLIHSFGSWPGVGLAASRRLRRRGMEALPVATSFTTYLHEALGKFRGVGSGYPLSVRAWHWGELAWIRAFVNPSERRGLSGAEIVFVNYESVRGIVANECGPGVRFARMTYCSEAAFLREGTGRAARPEALDALAPSHASLIVSVSRHDARKGLDVLLQALAELRRRNVPFRACLVGGGDLLELHRNLASRLDLGGCVSLVGKVNDAYAYLEHADIFVLPSVQEGSGSVSLLEAMQAGLAPVLSRIDGVPEDVREGESALLAEPGDSASLVTALAKLLSDPALRTRIAQGARGQYVERFSAEAFAADLQRRYAELGFLPN